MPIAEPIIATKGPPITTPKKVNITASIIKPIAPEKKPASKKLYFSLSIVILTL